MYADALSRVRVALLETPDQNDNVLLPFVWSSLHHSQRHDRCVLVLKLLDDGRDNTIAFAIKAILRLKDLGRIDAKELEANRASMETLLIAA